MLQEGGAVAILLENDEDKKISAISFRLKTTFGTVAYSLPANVAAVILTLNAKIREENERVSRGRGYKRKIPVRLFNDRAQAERIAWRIVKDWLEAQLAIHQLGSAKLEQVMLPFAVDETGKTFYERLVERGSLALPAHEVAQ
jgi:hypothetical protein